LYNVRDAKAAAPWAAREMGFAVTDIADRSATQRGIPRDKAPDPVLGSLPITGERYSSREFAELEWEKLWTKVWLVAGRVDQVRKPGDYVTVQIGRESILISRGDDDRIRAFYNVCQHRGNRLVHAEVGSLATGQFQCAYHGWRFASNGELNWVYCEEDFPQGTPCGKRNLAEIPCDTWGGFVWINMDESCTQSLREYLSPVAEHLDGYEMETMKRTHWVTLEGDFNWKCIQDNFNESYHLPYVHPQTLWSLNEHYTGCQFDMYPSMAPARSTRAKPTARSRRSTRSSRTGSSIPSRTATTSQVCAWRCSSANVSSASRRATTSRTTPTSSSRTTTTTRCSRTCRSR
jgi:phenylpropionate dioxygenase-like ring-hydroxylating dioxygenase large terminal subunit